MGIGLSARWTFNYRNFKQLNCVSFELVKLIWYRLAMINKELKDLIEIFKTYPEIKVVYLFGSKALDIDGPLSDYDFAIYFDGMDRKKMFDLKLELVERLSRFLGTDKIDIVILNTTEAPELNYQIIKEGKVVYEEQPYRILIEPKILNEYFDFHYMLSKYGLTKAWVNDRPISYRKQVKFC